MRSRLKTRLFVERSTENARIATASLSDQYRLRRGRHPDFNTLHSRKHDEEAQLCAFDILVEGSDDLRKLPLHLRKTSLERPLARRPRASSSTRSSVARLAPISIGAACRMGLEGIVSKRRDRPSQGGRSKHWVKIKNRQHPAMERVMDTFG
jgi:bifunctional non-homologous end joining protein LigD